jgi:hypothetical protein
MTPPLASRQPDNPIHRISRRPDAWSWPDWAYAGEDGTFGNRYDDPHGEYRVLYASSQRLGAFLETLARYRPDPAVIAAYAEIASDEQDEAFPTIAPGLVPAEWLERRCIGSATHDGRFADVGHTDSLAHLRVALADRVLHHRLGDLDGAELRRRAPRAFRRSRATSSRPRTSTTSSPCAGSATSRGWATSSRTGRSSSPASPTTRAAGRSSPPTPICRARLRSST